MPKKKFSHAAIEKFLSSLDHCRFATIDKTGYPHCVPVGYIYIKPFIYIPTNSQTRKVSNLLANPKCCIIVDIYQEGVGKGVMLQGTAQVALGEEYKELKVKIERVSNWNLSAWSINGRPVDAIIKFNPEHIVVIGNL
ncbi:MAG: pyridoxamine 5'-phosphate oxidase family protein [Thermoproteota archaeon]|jgi:Predicted flavin-nucleotide-binding protein